MKRRSKRYIVFIDAAIKLDGRSYSGIAGNISEEGIYLRIRSADAELYFAPGSVLDLSLRLPLERTLDMQCRIIWAYEIPLDSKSGISSYNLGLEIITNAPGYKKLYENEAMKHFNNQIKSIS